MKNKKNLEYKINKGTLEDFEKDITSYHLARIRVKNNFEYVDKLKEDLIKKYGLSEKEYVYNYFTHFDKLKGRYN